MFAGGASLSYAQKGHVFNGVYKGAYLQQVAFPIGGIGAGMFCLEGTGAISHLSVRNNPEMFNEPAAFAAISIKQLPGSARVLEGPVPAWKKFGQRDAGFGAPGTTWGLPRFRDATFLARFPFAEIVLKDKELPLEVHITGWSPFIPTDADNSSLPAGALEYTFRNTGQRTMDYVFSYNARNFMSLPNERGKEQSANRIGAIRQGFVLSQDGSKDAPEKKGDFAIFTYDADPNVVVDHCWFRGGWWDPFSMAWNNIEKGILHKTPPVEKDAPGASLFVPFTLKPGEEKKICLLMAWYVPDTHLRIGDEPTNSKDSTVRDASVDLPSRFHKPWYSSKFSDINAVADYWREHYAALRQNSASFRDAFYKSSLPPEVTEAVAANLGPDFPAGIFVCQDGNNTPPGPAGHQNFKLVRLENVIDAASLPA